MVGLVGFFAFTKRQGPTTNQTAISPSPNTTQTIASETANWKIYKSDKYALSMRYPNDWRAIDFQSETGMGTLDTFGFIPLALKNSYCDVGQQAGFLVQNYKTYNPFPGHEEYAQTLAKVESCSLQVRVEENPKKLSTKDFLKKVYFPIADNRQVMERRIDSLMVTKDDGTERVMNSYAFLKYLGGIDGSYTETSIEDGRRQAVINTGKYTIFITDHLEKPVDQQAAKELFEEILRSSQF